MMVLPWGAVVDIAESPWLESDAQASARKSRRLVDFRRRRCRAVDLIERQVVDVWPALLHECAGRYACKLPKLVAEVGLVAIPAIDSNRAPVNEGLFMRMLDHRAKSHQPRILLGRHSDRPKRSKRRSGQFNYHLTDRA